MKNSPLQKTLFLLSFFGLFWLSLNAHGQDLDISEEQKKEWVIVEPYVFSERSSNTGEFSMIPYKHRREKWGSKLSLSFSTYEPTSFDPTFSVNSYDIIYGGESVGYPELKFLYKRNLSLMSIGAEMSIGSLNIGSSVAATDVSSLSLMPVTMGLRVDLDMIMDEPLMVPYFSVGTYLMIYSETQGAFTKDGNTSFAGYFTAGLEFQLDWLDKDSDQISYVESGIENTFFYLEGRQLIASAEAIDPNFESDVHLNAGLTFEF